MIYMLDEPREFREGMTLADAFADKKRSMEGPFLVYVNDEVVDYSEYKTFVLHDEDDIQIMYTFFAEG